eukprot:CAMPEP_0203918788 /NCGR_PEP_ID=MMETSP0359-20131031/59292_1 /ASSEMBLY_ACC=CAM_ASM_000338 /TAXON_ID=268821 /ORGANISM="Scrippsiella Hangoei, Strain SHTV-5" /LENGTH=87 /DNA_ID=CAMNT_0050845957 /DNA_START=199 /DNA_END=462 /DNA_ORIENTATION=-
MRLSVHKHNNVLLNAPCRRDRIAISSRHSNAQKQAQEFDLRSGYGRLIVMPLEWMNVPMGSVGAAIERMRPMAVSRKSMGMSGDPMD